MSSSTECSNELWLSDPVGAHAQWRSGLVVADRAYAEQSQRLYASLFARFCAWMRAQSRDGQALTLATFTGPDVGAFLDTLQGRGGKAASARTRRTYLAEIDRVMQHLLALQLRQDNPALALLEQARLIAPLKPRNIHLPAADMPERFHALLRDLDCSQAVTPPQLQDICMALLMLECGLTLKEVQKLLLSHVIVEGQAVTAIKAPGHRTIMPRQIALNEVCARWLGRWLHARQQLRVVSRHDYADLRRSLHSRGYRWDDLAQQHLTRQPRQTLFVSFAGHTPRPGSSERGVRALGLAIDKLADEQVFAAAEQAVFALSPIGPEDRASVRHKGPQALRNLCCARMMVSGRPVSEIAQALGLRRNDQVWAMGRQLRLGSSPQS